MADIRLDPNFIDDFERANENPVQPPWELFDAPFIPMQLDNGVINGTSFNPSNSSQQYYGALPLTGDIIEAWGESFGNANTQDAYRLGLLDGSNSGYLCYMPNNPGDDEWIIRKYTNGTFSILAQGTPPQSAPSLGDLVLMQTDATSVYCYYSTDNGANWTLMVTGVDADYRTDMYITLGANGEAPGWEMAGGADETELSQIYRRPNE